MWISDFNCYRGVLREWIEDQPNKGRGQLSQLAKHLEVSPVNISQILNFERELPLNLALKTTQYMDFSDYETEYFLLLVEIARSKDDQLTQYLKDKLTHMKKNNVQIKTQIKHQQLTPLEQSQFYSNYLYSSIRLCSDIEELNSVDDIAQHLKVSRNLVADKVNFLVQSGLIEFSSQNKMKLGAPVTHAGEDSPYSGNHHKNWRFKALEKIANTKPGQNLHYTGPMVLSHQVAQEIREEITKIIKKSTQKVKDSTSEVHYCLNIDWFKVG